MTSPLKSLRAKLAEPATQVGTVQTVNSDGTSNVQLVGGGIVRASGDNFSIGAPVFVKGGRIVSEAPSLNIQLVEI